MRDRSPVRSVAMLVGILFVLTAILGFVPGVTTNYDEMAFAGNESEAKLLGVFQVSILHNVVHGLFGLAGLLLARTAAGARTYLVGGGVVYLLLFLYGIVVGADAGANFMPVNGADDVLHLLLGIGMLGVGIVLARDRTATRPTT